MSDAPAELVIVGSIGLDDVETPFDRREGLLGGSVSYACVAASFFVKTGMVGVVGEDFPEEYRQLYVGKGIDVSGLEQVAGKTFRWGGVYEDDMINRRTLFTELNVFEQFEPKVPESYHGAPYVMLGNISPELQLAVLEQSRGASFVMADTMDLWINIALEPLREVMSRVDMLMLNDSEAALLTGRRNMREAAEAILDMGPKYVVIKRGEHGAMLFSGPHIYFVPAYPVHAVHDPTGAGDTFAGAFMGALAKSGEVSDKTIRNALLTGSVVASFNVESFSLDRITDVKMHEIESRIDQLFRMISL